MPRSKIQDKQVNTVHLIGPSERLGHKTSLKCLGLGAVDRYHVRQINGLDPETGELCEVFNIINIAKTEIKRCLILSIP